MNNAAKKYLRRVRAALPCTRRMKNKIATDFQATLSQYLAENPDPDYAELELRFGTPLQIAAAYVDELDSKELIRDLNVRKKIVGILTATALVIVLIWAAVVSVALVDAIQSNHGFGNVTTEVIN